MYSIQSAIYRKFNIYRSRIIDSQFKRVKNLPGDTYAEKRKLALQKKVRNVDPRAQKRVKAV